jgi:putative DNA primase/helicase
MPHNLYRNIGGKCPLSGDKVYSIDSEKLDQQHQLAELHLAKSNTIELKTVSEQQQDKEPSNESPYFAMMDNEARFFNFNLDDHEKQIGIG